VTASVPVQYQPRGNDDGPVAKPPHTYIAEVSVPHFCGIKKAMPPRGRDGETRTESGTDSTASTPGSRSGTQYRPDFDRSPAF